MKKLFALILATAMVFSFTGCSTEEIEHFDSLFNTNVEGKVELSSTFDVFIDPENFASAIMDAGNQIMSEYEKEYYSEEDIEIVPDAQNDSFDIVVGEDGSTEAADLENSEDVSDNDYEDLFVKMMLKEMRVAFDENKLFKFSVIVDGSADMDNMIADESIKIKFNNITVDCGNAYTRDNNTYISKRLFYTLGAISYISDAEKLNAYFNSLDEIFDEDEFVSMSYDELNMASQENAALSIVSSSDMLQLAQQEMYNRAKVIYADFNGGYVKKVENGTSLSINGVQLKEFLKHFASYTRQHNNEVATLCNDYNSLVMGVSGAMYGNAFKDTYLEDSIYADDITGEDVVLAMDSLKEGINSKEYDIYFDTLGLTLDSTATEKDGIKSVSIDINGSYSEKDAISISLKSEVKTVNEVTLDEINEESSIGINEFMELLMNLHNGLNSTYEYSYYCEKCDESYGLTETMYCEKCGFIHDFYDYDFACDVQHGCESANEGREVA